MKILITLAYLAVIAVNYLANALPIGGITTGEASDSLPNLFTPAGITFSIWGVIYLLLAVYVIYSWGLIGKKRNKKTDELIKKVDKIFILNALANISWIFAWHYRYIGVSVLIMIVLLVSLILIANQINNKKLTLTDQICLRLPFSIYFGWITIATIANVSVFLVSLNWDGFGISDEIWTIIVLLVGATIGIWRSIKDKNIPYILVFIWAYAGIIFKHNSMDGFAGQYPNIILTAIICIFFYIGTMAWVRFRLKLKN